VSQRYPAKCFSNLVYTLNTHNLISGLPKFDFCAEKYSALEYEINNVCCLSKNEDDKKTILLRKDCFV